MATVAGPFNGGTNGLFNQPYFAANQTNPFNYTYNNAYQFLDLILTMNADGLTVPVPLDSFSSERLIYARTRTDVTNIVGGSGHGRCDAFAASAIWIVISGRSIFVVIPKNNSGGVDFALHSSVIGSMLVATLWTSPLSRLRQPPHATNRRDACCRRSRRRRENH